jgi:hypothetical protein
MVNHRHKNPKTPRATNSGIISSTFEQTEDKKAEGY